MLTHEDGAPRRENEEKDPILAEIEQDAPAPAADPVMEEIEEVLQDEPLLDEELLESSYDHEFPQELDDAGLMPFEVYQTLSKTVVKKQEVVQGSVFNIQTILTQDARLRGSLAYDSFAKTSVWREPVEWNVPSIAPIKINRGKPYAPFEDGHYSDIRAFLSQPYTGQMRPTGGYGLNCARDVIHDAVEVVSRANAFNPVMDMFESVEWDGVERIPTMFTDFLGCPDNTYHREAANLLMRGMMHRVHLPGSVVDLMWILESREQGTGKTHFWRYLSGDYFSEPEASDMKDAGRKTETLEGALICNFDELTAFFALDPQEANQLLSRGEFKGRRAFAKKNSWMEITAIVVGTTNRKAYLTDTSDGNRRYLPIILHRRYHRLHKIDLDRFKATVPQLHAEALVKYRALGDEVGYDKVRFEMSEEAVAYQKKLTDRARIEQEADSLGAHIEDLLTRPVALANSKEGADLLQNGWGHFFAVGPHVYRKMWCRKQILEQLKGMDEKELDRIRDLTKKNNPFFVAIQSIPFIEANGLSAPVYGYGEPKVGHRQLEIDEETFKRTLGVRDHENDFEDHELPF